MSLHISPTRVATAETVPKNLDEKITLFTEQVAGWQIDIADKIANQIPDAAFAVLATCMSYPEKIWQYINGEDSDKKSRRAFREGMSYIFPSIDLSNPAHEAGVDEIYEQVRCHLYHSGGTGPDVILSHQFDHTFAVVGSQIHINPRLLPGALRRHLDGYVADLRDLSNATLRANFETMFGVA